MLVGVPREIKDNENRVSLTPAGVVELVHHGHQVVVERGAGTGSFFTDDEYATAGAELVATHEEVFARAALVLKVKEPVSSEYTLLRDGQLLFTYLHLAADEALTRALMAQGVTAIAYETVEVARTLPLLMPMSEVAGRMSVQVGAHYLEKTNGGRGLLLGGVPGVRPSHVVIVGGGVVGTNAAQMALGAGAMVTILEKSADRMRYLSEILHGNLATVMSNRHSVGEAVAEADLLIGAVLIPGAKAPKLVSEAMIRTMRPGAVVVDVAIDQGGCIETARPTSHSDPTYEIDGVIHYCVTNMPGAVPRTSTYALSNVTLPYALNLADQGFLDAVRHDPALAKGVNTYAGQITYGAVAEAFGLSYTPLAELLVGSTVPV
ncbi:MAG: alanine dehydrogenase [Thermomicrobiales bacterium]|jgi:alanine dehydrogenase|nr:alanine dehydrogenase [Thermomicrobiales bacterium]